MSPAIGRYIRALRNPAKRSYAELVIRWMAAGEHGAGPDWAPLSYMAAQAVRARIRELAIAPAPHPGPTVDCWRTKRGKLTRKAARYLARRAADHHGFIQEEIIGKR